MRRQFRAISSRRSSSGSNKPCLNEVIHTAPCPISILLLAYLVFRTKIHAETHHTTRLQYHLHYPPPLRPPSALAPSLSIPPPPLPTVTTITAATAAATVTSIIGLSSPTAVPDTVAERYNRCPYSIAPSTVLPRETVFADTAIDYGLQLRGGGLESNDIEPPSPIDRKVSAARDAGQYDVSTAGMRSERKGKEVSISNESPEIIATQQSIRDYRAKLAQDMEEKAHGSPAGNLEDGRMFPNREDLSYSPNSGPDLPTTSTESNKTIREAITPGVVAGTPSYPFPRMNTPGFRPSHLQKSMSLSGGQALHDQLTSDPSTPASAMTFLPAGCAPVPENPQYPSPNLYNLSLMLSAEPGLNSWWDTVVQIMTECYRAERITLSVPADATDVDNIPWGQKATYNQTELDFSMECTAGSGSLVDDKISMPSTAERAQSRESPIRPSIQTRHSFTAYEENKESRRVQLGETAASSAHRRPGLSSRSKSHYVGAERSAINSPETALNKEALQEHDAVEEQRPFQRPLPSWEATMGMESERVLKGRVLPVLQALDLEADPLIDHNGITKVINQGKVIALTPKSQGKKSVIPDIIDEGPPRPPTPRFKLDPSVLEQRTNLRAKHGATSSPWSTPEDPPRKDQQPPIAILSILSPVIPYPSNLRYSLEHLAPHLATSFSLCRYYSNLETEVMGLSRKRPSNTGFGAIGPDGRPVAALSTLGHLGFSSTEEISQRSITGSLTSPSDYSTQSRSIAGSPAGTPFLETGFGLVVDRRTTGTSPGPAGGDSYFNPKPKGGAYAETPPIISSHRSPRNPKEVASNRQRQRSASLRKQPQDPVSTQEAETSEAVVGYNASTEDEVLLPATKQRHASKDPDLSGRKEEPRVMQDVSDHPKRVTSLGSATQSGHKHTRLHSYGGDFATTFQSLPPSTPLLTKPTTSTQARSGPTSATQFSMNPPTDRLKGLMLDLVPAQVFVAWPTLADLVANPWASFHEEDREDYIRTWSHSLRTGEQFVHTVRLRRFDGAYRWHQARAVASRDKRGVIVQFIGSYMDIHDQKVAELRALRQAEVEASEAKHRLLANLIPQIIFTATQNDGITFANERWLAYTGQSEDGALRDGFMDFVHPEDLARCRLPISRSSTSMTEKNLPDLSSSANIQDTAPPVTLENSSSQASSKPSLATPQGKSTAGSQASNLHNADLSELAKKGIIKVTKDGDGRVSYTTELRLKSKTGEYRWHLIRCVEIDDVDFGSGPSSYFGSATDINDHKLLEAKLKEAMESKGRFLSNMSHEIRTPLIGISGMVNLLQDTTLSEEQRDCTNTIQTSSNSLLLIINDILDLSKVDAGMMKLKFDWFHTRALVEDVNELVSTMAISKRLELNYIVEENVPPWVKGDKFRIRQVLLNVIGNAIKFTEEGEVFSRCRVYTDYDDEIGENQIMLEYSVIDTGRGFTKEEASLIFKPFSQIDGSSTRQHGGSGLGLVISRQLVELHGGRMEGSAVPKKGSTFTFTARFGLPSATDHPDMTGTPPMTATAQSLGEDKAMHTIRPLMSKSLEKAPAASPSPDAEPPSPASPAFTSSASSDPSMRSGRTQNTTSSSVSSLIVGISPFSEAAKASGQDLSQMRFDMPTGRLSLQMVATPDITNTTTSLGSSRLLMYSILIICPPRYSREAITKHIEMTLPKLVPHQITALSSVSEAQDLISGDESVTFTHVVVNLGSAEETLNVTHQIVTSSGGKTIVVIMSDSLQRQAILDLDSASSHPRFLADKQIIFVHKPVKPSRFAVIFDPARERDVSMDLSRSRAAQMLESQKQSYLDVEKRIGDKGVKVLLVEDNPVNQKVLSRYLKKVGIEAEIAADGMEATERVFAQSPKYYSLILCDLHMPRKDGYQTCREVRRWEQENNYDPMPIIALSANPLTEYDCGLGGGIASLAAFSGEEKMGFYAAYKQLEES
ncbi:hypothetical protein O1611_g938 [Lasiodiplodia mahajangana]|uniref:Uncharacterized protein n=1 Tax=Lasiodiplodia mahajangana TaxID=1108764 RepID=A0ACC2JYZ8_9PEZI|nr:hypothetical protein O1611_g938 [Lasiodiplodia mahajangana]